MVRFIGAESFLSLKRLKMKRENAHSDAPAKGSKAGGRDD